MLHINRTADYVVLWKSHKRAEWAAVGLDHQAAELRQQLTGGDPRNFTPAAVLAAPPGTATAIPVAVAERPAVELAAALPMPADLPALGDRRRTGNPGIGKPADVATPRRTGG